MAAAFGRIHLDATSGRCPRQCMQPAASIRRGATAVTAHATRWPQTTRGQASHGHQSSTMQLLLMRLAPHSRAPPRRPPVACATSAPDKQQTGSGERDGGGSGGDDWSSRLLEVADKRRQRRNRRSDQGSSGSQGAAEAPAWPGADRHAFSDKARPAADGFEVRAAGPLSRLPLQACSMPCPCLALGRPPPPWPPLF